jgi:sugar phosphate isomerase/epimerase
MFVEGIARLPQNRADVQRFDAEVRTAKQAGAKVIRVVIIPGRRYERFDSDKEFREFAARGEKSLELAEPVATRHRVRLAIENHKGQRVPERLALLKRISSEYVGMCVDTGNSFALLDDPTEAVEAFAPWAYSVHLKDTAVRECEEGFLLADVTLGEGFLDLPKMVQILRASQPALEFSLEAHTRDPLLIPCLTEKYWATFADVPARDLARALKTVRTHASAKPLFRVSELPIDEQIRREEENVQQCLAYAREHLGL